MAMPIIREFTWCLPVISIRARVNMQIHIGFGDVVTPEPELLIYLSYDSGFCCARAARLHAGEVIAEKLEALVELSYAEQPHEELFRHVATRAVSQTGFGSAAHGD